MSARTRRPAIVAAVLAGWLSGCQASEYTEPDPAPLDGGALTTGGGQTSTPPDAGARRRTVMTRNPWGGPPGNLVVDGEFELSVTPSGGQTGWRAFHFSGGLRELQVETGGVCRGGLRCALLQTR
ncbi:MAG: hypothetical protein JRI23_31900 [Deltaproteobacteria bacterium]|jgi:hypothetical protein|nr:hypothetical protein [Deltaproteobacteria bacterium]MBW2536828.1 hypothetical protein [Deltaproteobacteria bacterium]